MADSYLTIAAVALSATMQKRLTAATTQQAHAGTVPAITDPAKWTTENAYLWASSPGWAEKWDYALASNPEPGYDPGANPAVITDSDILAAVQSLGA